MLFFCVSLLRKVLQDYCHGQSRFYGGTLATDGWLATQAVETLLSPPPPQNLLPTTYLYWWYQAVGSSWGSVRTHIKKQLSGQLKQVVNKFKQKRISQLKPYKMNQNHSMFFIYLQVFIQNQINQWRPLDDQAYRIPNNSIHFFIVIGVITVQHITYLCFFFQKFIYNHRPNNTRLALSYKISIKI